MSNGKILNLHKFEPLEKLKVKRVCIHPENEKKKTEKMA